MSLFPIPISHPYFPSLFPIPISHSHFLLSFSPPISHFTHTLFLAISSHDHLPLQPPTHLVPLVPLSPIVPLPDRPPTLIFDDCHPLIYRGRGWGWGDICDHFPPCYLFFVCIDQTCANIKSLDCADLAMKGLHNGEKA